MQDLIYIAIIFAFFAIAVGVVQLCDRVVRSADTPVEEKVA